MFRGRSQRRVRPRNSKEASVKQVGWDHQGKVKGSDGENSQ